MKGDNDGYLIKIKIFFIKFDFFVRKMGLLMSNKINRFKNKEKEDI